MSLQPKRIPRLKFQPGGAIKILVTNQFGEDYELDVSINIKELIDRGTRNFAGQPEMDVHLAVSYASYPKVEPLANAPTGELRQVPFAPSYPGPARVAFQDQEGQDREIHVTPVVVRVDDMGTRDSLRRSQFGIHLSAHYAHAGAGPAPEAPRPGAPPVAHVVGG